MGATNSFSLYIDVFIDLSNNSWKRNLLSFHEEVIAKSPIIQTKNTDKLHANYKVMESLYVSSKLRREMFVCYRNFAFQ